MGTNGAEVIMLIGNKCDLDRREVGLMHNFVWIYCQGKAIKGEKTIQGGAPDRWLRYFHVFIK
jgi:hypothetical protein